MHRSIGSSRILEGCRPGTPRTASPWRVSGGARGPGTGGPGCLRVAAPGEGPEDRVNGIRLLSGHAATTPPVPGEQHREALTQNGVPPSAR